MKNYTFNEAIELALKTWYPKDHPLHLNPHHPLGKLLGEWGELLDDYMKSLYKPGYVFEPEDELGDIWYYVRILCYQKQYQPLCIAWSDKSMDYYIALAMQGISGDFRQLVIDSNFIVSNHVLDISSMCLGAIAGHYNLVLDDLTRSNWDKLKPGSERGEQWAKARQA